MPSRAKKLDRAVSRLPSIPKELVAQFLSGPMNKLIWLALRNIAAEWDKAAHNCLYDDRFNAVG